MALTLTIADWCIFVAGLVVPFVFTLYAKASKDFDNAKPREYMEHLADARGVEAEHLAVGVVACRLVYGVMYVLDKATLRSLVWVAALGCVVALFVLSA